MRWEGNVVQNWSLSAQSKVRAGSLKGAGNHGYFMQKSSLLTSVLSPYIYTFIYHLQCRWAGQLSKTALDQRALQTSVYTSVCTCHPLEKIERVALDMFIWSMTSCRSSSQGSYRCGTKRLYRTVSLFSNLRLTFSTGNNKAFLGNGSLWKGSLNTLLLDLTRRGFCVRKP